MASGGEERNRTVRICCPSLPKSLSFLVCEDHRIDLGHIARAFGVDPATLKLNAHFIARGPDLVASSVTWRSLLSFFSSRGLPTGGSDSDALLVQGKLCRAGTKRAPVLDSTDNEISANNSTANLSLQLAEFSLFKNKKLRENSSEYIEQDSKAGMRNGFGLKRMRPQDDFSPLKRLTIK